MPRFKVAHIREQGVDLIIIPLEETFDRKTENDKNAIISDLQIHASSAGLAVQLFPFGAPATQ